MKKRRMKLSRIYIAAVLVFMYIPIALVILYSFNNSKITSVWDGFSLRWYVDLFRDRSMFEALRNSAVLALLSSLSSAVIGTLGAVGLSKAKPPGAKLIEYLATLPIMMPEIILGMIFLAFFSLLGLPFGLLTLVISHTAFCVPYILLLIKDRLVGIDKDYVEAAMDLGAGQTRAFFDITLPLIFPAILSGILLSIAMSFDDVIISAFVTGVNTNTLPLKIYTQIKTGVSPKVNAICTLLFAATVFLCLLSSWLSASKSERDKKNMEVYE